MPLQTFYCQHPSCAHHVDAWIEPPQYCPTCGREGHWESEPPPLEVCLTAKDKLMLKGHRMTAGDPVEEPQDDGA